MVTVLEAGLLEHFSIIFSLIFVIAIVYGLLQLTKTFGDTRGLQAIIALVSGVLVVMIPDVVELITIMIPWFVLLFIFILFLLMTYKIFGATDADITSALKGDRTIIWVIIIIAIVIVIGSFSAVYGQRLLSSDSSGTTGYGSTSDSSSDTTSFSRNVSAIFFHPKVLGLIFIMAVAVFTIALLSAQYKIS